jgi:hypothetical protein
MLDIYLDIAAIKGPKMLFGCLWVVGCTVVGAWFAATSHLEDLRATYLNEASPSGRRNVVLSAALMSDFRVSLRGLTTLYATVILLLGIVSRLLSGTTQ